MSSNIYTLTQTVQQPAQTVIFLKDQDPIEEEQKIQETDKKKKKPTRKIQWQEDTIDNEHLGRLKSNVCCIYHKPKDAENPSSGTCTSDDDGNALDRDRITKKRHKKKCSKFEQQKEEGDINQGSGGCGHHHHHHHNHSNGNDQNHQH
ncbi:protein phosphatase inhibitor protein (macronuclear) [Tetrahymena thermophila SB210]|uniref:Protein phosphatase inhibitor protein n=1 Tax=Tetrahymena thermophila (strain SB210) TaxID=312017 RepID=I7ME32_TETTS|nr:protein phosphatase inhibitor protein [Tetrahymena thermophila SB210]EAR94156.1 protein phosphatase inhibitor protein [Tetrahymena thermophila SB210]|eukprot:XP_001014401.1 protein phosphatase inhibitor protein [Tetrahymena thermophila SB210]